MLYVVILASFIVSTSAEPFICEKATDDSISENHKSTYERLAYLEEQVAVLKELAGSKTYDDVPEVLRIETLVTPKGE